MKRLLLVGLLWLAVGSITALLLNHYEVNLIDSTFHPSNNWFLAGIALLVVGGFRCMPSDTSRSFAHPYAFSSSQNLDQLQREENRFAKAIPGGLLMMACGALLVLVAVLRA